MKESSQILQNLASFWTHLALYKRKCDYSGEEIISIYPSECPYPVYHQKYWQDKGEMPSAEFDFSSDTFSQAWKLFQLTPIPHNTGEGNENCEYTDDSWHSKDCYLTHNALNIRNVYYSHRSIGLSDCRYCVYSYESQYCSELICSFHCYRVIYALHTRRCKDSAFLFDCEDCHDCLLCWNLKNKQYCIGNKQFTKEQYEIERNKYNLKSIKVFDTLREQFHAHVLKDVWWKSSHMLSVENCSGDFLTRCYDCHDCFLMDDSRNCTFGLRASFATDSEYFVSVIESSRVYNSVNVWERSDNIYHSVNISSSRNLEYCMFCFQCDDCFLCSGLVRKKYHILNKEYTESEYHALREKIIEHMKTRGEYGNMFPHYFSPSVYDETLAALYYPLTHIDQEKLGYRTARAEQAHIGSYVDISKIPDILTESNEQEVLNTIYWDPIEKRSVQFMPKDLELVKSLGIALNRGYYLRRIRENFFHLRLSLELREVQCAISGEKIITSLPKLLDGRIISEKEYFKL